MKKLLLIGTNSIHVYNYLALVRDAFDEVLLITDAKREGENVPAETVNFSLRSISARLFTARKIRKAAQRFKPDVIHIHQANSVAWYALNGVHGLGIPTVLTAWGSDVLLLPQRGGFLRRMVLQNIARATHCTADAQQLADAVTALVPGKKVTVANFGISIEPVELPKENIIYSNRLHKPLYRIDAVLRGFKRFTAAHTGRPWKLVIAATGEETENLKKLAETLGIASLVQFAGWADKKTNADFYARARIFVSLPESDATAISLLEAMACGCIPVLSDLPANREWVTPGKNGIIVTDTESDFFSAALQLDEHAVRLQNAAIIEARGTKAANRRIFLEVYKSVLTK